ncbi:8363_t:CDS:2, partial [Racocetra persica]
SFTAWEPFNNLIKETVPAYTYAPMKNESELRKCELKSRYKNKNSCFDEDVVNKVNEFIRGYKSNETNFLFIHLTDCDERGYDYRYDHGGVNQIKDDRTTIGVHGGNSEDEMNIFLSVCGPGILAASKIEGDLSNL